MTIRRTHSRLASLALATAAATAMPLVSAHNVGQDGAHPPIIPNNAVVYGNSMGEWSARWVQWFLSIPAATNPANDTTGASCAEGQSGPVWFLAGTSGINYPVTRACTVPAGKPMFIPILNTFFGAGVFDCEPTVPGTQCNLATLRASAAAAMDPVTLRAEMDGKRLTRLESQRITTPAYTITYPEGSVTGVASGSYSPNVADGYWLMVAPPKKGSHTLLIKGDITGGPFAGFSVDVTYNLTIQ